MYFRRVDFIKMNDLRSVWPYIGVLLVSLFPQLAEAQAAAVRGPFIHVGTMLYSQSVGDGPFSTGTGLKAGVGVPLGSRARVVGALGRALLRSNGRSMGPYPSGPIFGVGFVDLGLEVNLRESDVVTPFLLLGANSSAMVLDALPGERILTSGGFTLGVGAYYPTDARLLAKGQVALSGGQFSREFVNEVEVPIEKPTDFVAVRFSLTLVWAPFNGR